MRLDHKYEGNTYGKLTIVGPAFELPRNRHRQKKDYFVVCVCECGTHCAPMLCNVTKGKTTSCGCYARAKHLELNTLHGMSKDPIYAVWTQMKMRCTNKNNLAFSRYGGRGIKICDRWLEADGQGFLNFLTDMGPRPSDKHSIDRIDVNGDYCPENCRWATAKEQQDTKRTTLNMTLGGETKSLRLWCEEYKISYKLVHHRIFGHGWDLGRALRTPPRSTTKRSRSNECSNRS